MAERKRIASLSVYSKDLGLTEGVTLSLTGTEAQVAKNFGSAILNVGEDTHYGTFNLRAKKDGGAVISLTGFKENAPIKGGVLFKDAGEDGHTFFSGELDNQAGEGFRATSTVLSQSEDLKPLGDVVMKKDLTAKEAVAPTLDVEAPAPVSEAKSKSRTFSA